MGDNDPGAIKKKMVQMAFFLYKMVFMAALSNFRILLKNAETVGLGAVRLAAIARQSARDSTQTERRLGKYALVYSLQGRCSYWDEQNGGRILEAGDLLILFPEIAHRYGAEPGDQWDEFFIVFDGPVFDLWREKGLLDPHNPVISLHPVPFWSSRLEACLEVGGATGKLATLLRVCALQSLLTDILSIQAPSGSNPGTPPWLDRACALLGDITHSSASLDTLARALGLSTETFRKKFVTAMGTSPGRYRTKKTMDLACSLLLETRLSGKEIASQLGFSDEFHFSRRFKEISGLSPSEFRRCLIPPTR